MQVLQKQKLELQQASGSQELIRQIDRQMIDLEIYRRRRNRQPSQPSAAQVAAVQAAEAESSEDESMPDFDPPRTQLRF